MSFDQDNPLPPEPGKDPSASAPVFEIEPARAADSGSMEPAFAVDASATAYPDYPRPSIPDDLRVPWNWSDIFLLVGVAIGGGILISFIVMAGLSLFGVQVLRLLRESPEKLNQLNVVIQVVLDLGILAYLAAQMRLRFHSPFWRTIGWRPLEPAKLSRNATYIALVLGGFLLSFVVTLASNIFPPEKELPIQALLQDRYTALLFILVAVLVAPVVQGYLVSMSPAWAETGKQRADQIAELARVGDVEKALALSNTWLATHPDDSNVLLRRSELLSTNQRLEQALVDIT